MTLPGYEANIVLAFLQDRGHFDGDKLESLNGERVSAAHRQSIERWWRYDVVPLDRVDTMLLNYGLMTWELEDFARAQFGREGFVDPNAEPASLAA